VYIWQTEQQDWRFCPFEVLRNYHKAPDNFALRADRQNITTFWAILVLRFGPIPAQGWGSLRRLVLISIDLLFVASATVIAVMLRGNFDSVSGSLVILMPYIVISVGCASLVFLVAGLDRTPWRFSTVADHLQVVVLTVLAVLLALVVTFALNRLEPIARSLPVFQAALIVSILVSARGVARFWHARQIHVNGNDRVNGQPCETVLVVGVNSISELFLLSVKEFASKRVQVVGVLAEEPNMQGRAIQQTPILGTAEELQDILQSLEVHGVAVNRIVVATPTDRLRPRSLEVLFEIEKSSNIVVQFLSERLGFEDFSQRPSVLSGEERSLPGQRAVARLGNVIDVDHTNFAGKSFRLQKRIVDVLVATFLTIILAPVAILVAFIVALDVGFPLIFWQQRPGLYGRPFKLYKFRTMRAPHDSQQNRIPDDQRSSAIGQLIRRSRLDELPQLYNVLIGDMSLIGPRPLLPCDQSPDYAARLSVRPGVTGWAQVNGGRIISTSDKLILDIWYVQNASFVLDLKILLCTLKMVLFGDRINTDAVNRARSDLGLKMLLRTKMVPAE
jgi:lipopolysaccharide/colanic/teichoic acid biosynthesis glycosyltransferase